MPFVIITGNAATALGCPDSVAVAHERQDWHAYAVREPWAGQTLYGLDPGQPFAFNFTVANSDTYSVVLWGSNSAGAGCRSVVVANGHTTVDVGPTADSEPTEERWYDLAGRRVHPSRSGIYFGLRKRKVVVR